MYIRRALPAAALLLVSLLAGACAKPPGSITPVAVSSRDFESLDCKSLSQKINDNTDVLHEAERKQRNAVAADTAGVFLVLIPPTVFTGDSEDEVALAKGNDVALRRAFDQKCL